MKEWKGRRENKPRETGEKPFKGLFNTCIDKNEEWNCSLYDVVAEFI